MRADIQQALVAGVSAFRYVGEPATTRGDLGESVYVVVRLGWDPEKGGWFETPEGHTWGVWDSTFGWMPCFYLDEDDIGEAFMGR